ncbi:hypothetical protein [Escherichia coli]|uniref:hypothetical protein n=1 Tax=Escherichia coli TaxID=562 RepID=UPI00201AD864|nr:hypothetical protein [Escherichia coli]
MVTCSATPGGAVPPVNDRKITADGKEGPGDRSGEAYPCIPASPAKMEARHSPHTTLRPQS